TRGLEQARFGHGGRAENPRRDRLRHACRAVVVLEPALWKEQKQREHRTMSEHNPKQIRILTVDDHPLLRQGIAALIADEADMTVVAEATNGREAIQQFRTHHPDVTLMDLQMPEMNGLDAMIAIRGEFPDARIIVLTTYT